MLAVMAVEARLVGSAAGGPITRALLDLADAYADRDAPVLPDVSGPVGPAWLVPTAVAHIDVLAAARDAVGLVGPRPACVSYVQLASCILAGTVFGGHTLESGGGDTQPPTPASDPNSAALATALWALTRPTPLGELLPMLAHATGLPAAAAAGGLVGIRDGLDAVPVRWYRRLDHAPEALALAACLTHTRRDRTRLAQRHALVDPVHRFTSR
jgi:hypothetical protein